jgi:predicted TIM-barrel fold metal-dependent hydrolase
MKSMAEERAKRVKAPAYTVDEAWLARGLEPALEPALPIIDPHHHLWERPQNSYFLPQLTADLASGHDFRATVFIECTSTYREDGPPELRPLGETAFVAGVAREVEERGDRCQVCAAIVGYVDLRLGEAVRPILEAHAKLAEGRLRGMRHNAMLHPDFDFPLPKAKTPPSREMLLDPAFRAGLACLAPLGLVYECWVFHTQLGEFESLAKAMPDTIMVLDHVGGPLDVDKTPESAARVFAEWRRGMERVARLPNVRVKIGGLGMRLFGPDFRARPTPPSSMELAESWLPYVETTIALFGPSRCMFESNFPVDKSVTSYGVLWNAFKRLAAGFSAAEKSDLFFGTAARTYGIIARPTASV